MNKRGDKMVEMINRISGTHMWVSQSRVAEYLNAGHKVVSHESPKAIEKNEPVEDFMNGFVDSDTQVEEPVKRGRGRGKARK